jgi:signal transduction histidine kinase
MLVLGWLQAGPARLPWLRLPWLRPPRTVQARLTAVYVSLFMVFGAGLLAITYLLLKSSQPQKVMLARGPTTAPADQLCYVSGGPTLPPSPDQNQGCMQFIAGQVRAQHASDLSTLLVGSGIALAGMTLLAIGIGWLVAGRVLSPLRTITMAAQRISASNLHQRLALPGPDDELKELGDTVDGLLARLECSFEAQRQFVANASHELRTPLARQRTLVEVALADPAPTVQRLQAVCGRVLAAGEQQERLIEALLTLARSQRGLDRWDQIDIGAITEDVVLARRAEAQRLGVSLSLAAGPPARPSAGSGDGPPPEPAVALGDVRLAERLVANLVDNALLHNVAGGWVSVWTGTSAGQAVLRVANFGPQIAPSEVARLFAPFQRLCASRTGERRDSPGLGLSIVSAIAAAHGAELRASALDAGGLDIQVRFPPLPVPDAAEPGRVSATTGPSTD